MAASNFSESITSLYQGLDKVISSKTVVGDPVEVGGITIIPLVDVQFGMGAGSSGSNGGSNEKKAKNQGGLAGKVSPSSVLVIKDGHTRLINIKNQDNITKLLDLVPDVLDRIKDRKEDKMTEEDVMDILDKD